MKVNIKDVENGWLVHYDIFEHMGEGFEDRKSGENEKVFVYSFNDEIEEIWEEVIIFISNLYWDNRNKKGNSKLRYRDKKERRRKK